MADSDRKEQFLKGLFLAVLDALEKFLDAFVPPSIQICKFVLVFCQGVEISNIMNKCTSHEVIDDGLTQSFNVHRRS